MRNPKDKPAGCCETSVAQDSPVELRSPLSASTHLSCRIAPRGAISRPAHQLSWESADEFWVPFLEELHHLAEGDCRANLQKKTRCDLTTSPLRSPLAPPAPPVSPRRDLWRVRISRNLPTRRNRFLVEKLPVEIQSRPFSHLSPQRKQARQLEFQEKSPGKRDREDPSFERQSSSGRRFIEYIKRFRYINLLHPTHWRVRLIAT